MMLLEDFADLADDLYRRGFKYHSDSDDVQFVAEYPCDGCGQPRTYHGLKCGEEYFGFAECETCGIVEEL